MRGLKPEMIAEILPSQFVAPFTGAWIETHFNSTKLDTVDGSHPSRVRGLKHSLREAADELLGVAPFTGAWIETYLIPPYQHCQQSRTLHGCVD